MHGTSNYHITSLRSHLEGCTSLRCSAVTSAVLANASPTNATALHMRFPWKQNVPKPCMGHLITTLHHSEAIWKVAPASGALLSPPPYLPTPPRLMLPHCICGFLGNRTCQIHVWDI